MSLPNKRTILRSFDMNNLDVSGILKTYSERAKLARNKEHLKKIIKDLKSELDLRKIENFIAYKGF